MGTSLTRHRSHPHTADMVMDSSAVCEAEGGVCIQLTCALESVGPPDSRHMRFLTDFSSFQFDRFQCTSNGIIAKLPRPPL